MKVWVVTCYMEGCEECGNEYHVVGLYINEDEAREQARIHEELNSCDSIRRNWKEGMHLHSCCTHVEEVEVK